VTRSGPHATKLLIVGLVMILTNLPFGCFYSGPQLVSPPSPSVGLGSLGETNRMASSHERSPRQRRQSAAQLVALDDGWEPPGSSREWRYILVHHTATAEGDLRSIDAAHRRRTDDQGRPWLGIGYHFLIGNGHPMADGEVAATFRWTEQLHGAHAGDRLHNEQGIGVCLVGDFEQTPPTAQQMAAAQRLVQALARRYGIPRENILPHSQVTATECPGKLFPWDELFAPQTDQSPIRRIRADQLQSN
jgi:N-acetyl-anhydromuramyl-L-alanine amidase AmpD